MFKSTLPTYLIYLGMFASISMPFFKMFGVKGNKVYYKRKTNVL